MNTQIIRPPTFQRPNGYLYLDTFQPNLVNNTPTLVLLDKIETGFVDTIENITTHRITPGVEGFYSIAGKIRLESIVADKRYEIKLKISGAERSQNMFHSSNTEVISVQFSIPSWFLLATDYLEIWATSHAGVDTVDISSAHDTFLSIQRVR